MTEASKFCHIEETGSPSSSQTVAPDHVSTELTTSKPRTRLLKDVEAEENKTLHDQLYKSMFEPNSTSLMDDITSNMNDAAAENELIRQMNEIRESVSRAVIIPVAQKRQQFFNLLFQLNYKENSHVARAFFWFTAAMITLPLIAMLIGHYIIAPHWNVDPTIAAGFTAVGTTVFIQMSYVMYALVETSTVAQKSERSTPLHEAKMKKQN